ncbi:MAG: protein kinase domain-containing protein [Planctomycetota bacterium]|jgi:tRNA A-37 threonylcarbamoyl transferase component Bud32/CHASE2 domain-containing sensor protein
MVRDRPRWSLELEALYAQGGTDVDLGEFADRRAIRLDEPLAEVIEADGRARMARGLPVELRRYLDAFPDLPGRTDPLDAAIDVTLRSRAGTEAGDDAGVESLVDEHPELEAAIRDAAALGRLVDEGPAVGGNGIQSPPDAPPEAPPDAETLVGYDIVDEIHRGGQGVVYRAVQRSTERLVAVKVLARGRFATATQMRRFAREVRLAARLQHPNIVTIFDSGLDRGRWFYAMELVDGVPLDRFLAARQPDLETRVRLVAAICSAVRYAHAAGVIHRDLKPQNVLVDDEGRPHLLDFGLARPAAGATGDGRDEVTATREFTGTLAYAAPEQLAAEPALIDTRTDVYALGLLLYQVLADRLPYHLSGDVLEMAREILQRTPRPPSRWRPDLSPDLDTITLRAIARPREQRYQTVAALEADLERVLAGEPIEARRDRWLDRARSRATAFARAHRTVACLATLVVATLLAQALGTLALFRWSGLNNRFERAWVRGLTPAARLPSLDDVCVIVFEDAATMERVARAEGLDDVRADDVASFRRLHGRLMERLAEAGATVVAWDITFERETAFDQSFADGADRLRAAGADVLVSVPAWSLDGGRPPTQSPVLADSHVTWASVIGSFRPDAPWRLHVAAGRGLYSPVPSMALRAAGARRHPGTSMSFRIDPWTETLQIDHARRGSDGAGGSAPAPRVLDALELSTLTTRRRDEPRLGLAAGDVVGEFLLLLPDDETMARATMGYDAVLASAPDELRRRVADKVVVVGDLRPGMDRHDAYDGRREVPGCYALAAGIQSIVDGTVVRYPRSEAWWLLTLGSAAVGLLIAWLAPDRRALRWVGLAVMVPAWVGLSAWAFHRHLYLYNPVIPLLAMVLAAQILPALPRGASRWIPDPAREADPARTVRPR